MTHPSVAPSCNLELASFSAITEMDMFSINPKLQATLLQHIIGFFQSIIQYISNQYYKVQYCIQDK